MEREPLVSVVIPTYNRAHVLGRAIDSVLSQTLEPDEIIVVDDASDDDTAEVVEGYADPRIQLVRLERRQRAGHARNVGVERARGEWIAFLDSDDEWLPGKLAAQMALAADDVGVVACTSHKWGDDGTKTIVPKSDLAEGDALAQLLQGMKATTSAYVVRRDALLDAGGFDENLRSSEDYDLLLRLAQGGHRYAAVHEPLVIIHAQGSDRMSVDAIGRLQGHRSMNRRWGALMKELAGRKRYKSWRRKRQREHKELHARHVAQLSSRSDALRYAARMIPHLPWGTRYVGRALALAVTGARDVAAPEQAGEAKEGVR